MSEKIPFLDMFPDCASLRDSCGGLDKAEVLRCSSSASMTMLLHTWFARMPAPVERTNIEQLLAAAVSAARRGSSGISPPRSRKREKKATCHVLAASPFRSARTSPMNELTLAGAACVTPSRAGVCRQQPRDRKVRPSAVLSST
ncbi:MAG: hypothetical protein ACLSHG_11700 [Oscillospiraceae bacterium]